MTRVVHSHKREQLSVLIPTDTDEVFKSSQAPIIELPSLDRTL